MTSVVSLVKVNNAEEVKSSIDEALNLINFEPVGPVKSVAIKPNLCYYWQASTGYTTDPRVVAGIIDCLRERYGEDVNIRVVEADATAMRTKHAFVMLGYEKLAKEKSVKLQNLSSDDVEERTVQIDDHEITFKVPQTLLKTDLFINVPKLKLMVETKITCAFKNIFGCIASSRKIAYHPILAEAIVGINKILHPHLTIVDGIIALGRYPIALDLIMACRDSYSIDWVASRIMGHNPERIKFLRLAAREKLGNPRNIKTVGESLTTFKRVFPKANFFSSKYWWNLQLRLLKLYSRVANDVVPSVLEEI